MSCYYPIYNYYLTTLEIQEIERLFDTGETLKNIRQNFSLTPEILNYLFVNYQIKKEQRAKKKIE
jgi:ribosomal protein S6